MTATTRVFKSGNSVALRLPKSLGIKEGTEMTVREEKGRYIVEPLNNDGRIDLTGIYGSCPDIKPVKRLYLEPREIDWEGKLLDHG